MKTKKEIEAINFANEFMKQRVDEFRIYILDCLKFGSMESFDDQTDILKEFLEIQINQIKKGKL